MPKVTKGQKTYYQVSTVHKSLGYSPLFIFVDVKFQILKGCGCHQAQPLTLRDIHVAMISVDLSYHQVLFPQSNISFSYLPLCGFIEYFCVCQTPNMTKCTYCFIQLLFKSVKRIFFSVSCKVGQLATNSQLLFIWEYFYLAFIFEK